MRDFVQGLANELVSICLYLLQQLLTCSNVEGCNACRPFIIQNKSRLPRAEPAPGGNPSLPVGGKCGRKHRYISYGGIARVWERTDVTIANSC